MSEVHFFTDEGALCGAPSAGRLTIVETSVTCSTCAALLVQRELEEEQRPVPPPKVLANLRRTG